MIDPEVAVGLALDSAERALPVGEMPIGAVVLSGDNVLGEAFTQEQALGRRIVHADLLAMQQADEQLGFSRPDEPLVLAVSLEPCLMCLGAAITLGVQRVYYALESPNDGGVELLSLWHPPVEQSFFRAPAVIRGGYHRSRSQQLFRRYAEGDGPADTGMRAWSAELARLRSPEQTTGGDPPLGQVAALPPDAHHEWRRPRIRIPVRRRPPVKSARLADVKMSDVAEMTAKLDGVRRTTKDELAEWRYRGRLVARQLDDTHIVIRADFDYRDVLLRQFPATFSVPTRFEKHMMVVADIGSTDQGAIEDALVAARDLQRNAD